MFTLPKSLRTAVVLTGVLAAVAFAADPTAAPTVTQETAFTFYRPFTRLTKEPRFVSLRIAALCVGPS